MEVADHYEAIGERIERRAVHRMELKTEHIPVIPDVS